MTACKVCANIDGNIHHVAREMMYGYRDEFRYLECRQCGCVQIIDSPADLSRYYPDDYYSFTTSEPIKPGPVQDFLRRQRSSHCLDQKNLIGAVMARRYGIPAYFDWLKRMGAKLDSSIVDVGCGSGGLLLQLRRQGFANLVGIDPFITGDIVHNGVKILKQEVGSYQEQADFIMLNHSFEHMPAPLAVLKHLWRILKPSGCLLIRIPVVPSFAWEKYGVNWVQLDAPRHQFIHSIESLKLLAEQARFAIREIVFDSFDLQFWGSEKYLRDIPFTQVDSAPLFSEEELESFRGKAEQLNREGQGDQACFYLNKL